MQEMQVQSLGQEDPWRQKWQPAPVFLPGKFRGQRSLVGYCPWDRKELNMTEHYYLLYNIWLVSAVQWSESAICVHISPPSINSAATPSSPSRSPQSTDLSSRHYSRFPLQFCMAVHIRQSQSPYSSNHLHPTVLPECSSVHLHLCSCPANRFILLFF